MLRRRPPPSTIALAIVDLGPEPGRDSDEVTIAEVTASPDVVDAPPLPDVVAARSPDTLVVDRDTWGDHYHGRGSQMPRDLAYYLSADSAPRGYAVRRPPWVAPAFVATLVLTVAVTVQVLPPLTSAYASIVSGLSGSPKSRLLAGQNSLALRPFALVLLSALAAFSPGTWRSRVRLGVRAWATFLLASLIVDSLLADSVGFGLPNPFTHRGGVISVVVALLVFVWLLFTEYALPADVRVKSEVTRSARHLIVFAGVVVASAAVVLVAAGRLHGLLSQADIPLVNGFASVVVLFLASAQVLLFAASKAHRNPPAVSETWIAPPIGVITPAYNEEYSIAAVIDALDAAARAYPGPVTLRLVNNGSEDDTERVAVAALAGCLRLRGEVLNCPTPGKSFALNTGLAATTEPIVIRVDADTLVEPTLFTRVAPYFRDHAVGGVSGLPLPRRDAPRWIYAIRLMEVLYSVAFLRVGLSSADAAVVMPGNMSAYRGDVIRDLGFGIGFNGEDTDSAVRIGRAGYQVITDPQIKFYPEVPATIGQLREQRTRWARGIFHVASRNKSGVSMHQGVRCVLSLPWSAINASRRTLMIPMFSVAGVVALLRPEIVTLQEVAVIGGIIVGIHAGVIVLMLIGYRHLRYLPYVPLYLLFRAFKLYVAMEALLTLEVSRQRSSADTAAVGPQAANEAGAVGGF